MNEEKNILKKGRNPKNEIDTQNLKEELKNLPKVIPPDDFDSKLYSKISDLKYQKSAGFFEKLFFPMGNSRSTVLIYAAVVVILLCFVLLTNIVMKNLGENSPMESKTIDSTYYQGKKVIIFPPSSSPEEKQLGADPLHDMDDTNNGADKENIHKYIEPKNMTKADSALRNSIINSNTKKTAVPTKNKDK